MKYRSDLTAARLREVISYDQDTGAFTWKKPPWNHPHLVKAGTVIRGYLVIQIDEVVYKASRLAWLYVTGKWPPGNIDHRDRDSSNNRFSNLRIATLFQNAQNHSHDLRIKASGVPVGVHHDPRHGIKHYQARIAFEGKSISLGYFETAEQARGVYLRKRRELFGEFAPK